VNGLPYCIVVRRHIISRTHSNAVMAVLMEPLEVIPADRLKVDGIDLVCFS
jgi:hypothetical protein